MARNDDGEFELILGNRQLLSIFFIVVVLLGVFFTMGYIVGKSTAQPDMASRSSGPIVVVPKEPGGAAGAARPTPEPAREPLVPREPAPTPRAAVEEPRPTEPPRAAPTPKPTRPSPSEPAPPREPAAKPAPPPPSEKPATLPTGQPAPGQMFLQVVAGSRPDSEVVAEVLRKKGFSTLVAPVPNDKLFRVLVGPLRDTAEITRVRASLEEHGFQKPILRKY